MNRNVHFRQAKDTVWEIVSDARVVGTVCHLNAKATNEPERWVTTLVLGPLLRVETAVTTSKRAAEFFAMGMLSESEQDHLTNIAQDGFEPLFIPSATDATK